MRHLLSCAIISAAGLLCAVTEADITILKSDGSAASTSEVTKTYNQVTGGWDITLKELYAPGLFTRYDVHGDGGEIIDNLYIDVPWALGSPVVVKVICDEPLGIGEIKNIKQRGSAETILENAEATGDIGSVEVEMIGFLTAGRDIIGPVRATVSNSENLGITRVEAKRNILGDVTAANGRIITVYSHEDIGTEENPVKLRARHRIVLVLAHENVYADINTRANGGAGWMYKFSANRFKGTLETEELQKNPYNGKSGRFEVFESFEGTFIVGKSYIDPLQRMVIPAEGLKGNIIINADGEPDGAWSAPVHIGEEGDPGQAMLSGPDYPETAELLGGGSVGLVPFSLHGQSCDPPEGAVLDADAVADSFSIKLRHYGPVQIDGSEPLIVERRPFGSAGAFEPVPAGFLFFMVAGDDSNSILIGNAKNRTGFEAGFEYRFSATNELRCQAEGDPAVAWLAPFTFSIESPPCAGDLDASGKVDVTDLLLLLAYWGDGDGSPGDLDGSGVVDVLDLLVLLSRWGLC